MRISDSERSINPIVDVSLGVLFGIGALEAHERNDAFGVAFFSVGGLALIGYGLYRHFNDN